MKININSNNYPEILRNQDQWVNQKVTWNEEKKKYSKKPRNSRSGMAARWSNPETWSSVEDAEKLHKTDPESIPAFILDGSNNLVCIDYDDCCDEDGNLNWFAQTLVNTFESYAERSVSGNGIHILCKGTTTMSGDVTIEYNGQELDIEVFTKKRIITLTGNLINPDLNEVKENQLVLESLEEKVKPKPKPPGGFTVGSGPSFTSSLQPDQEIKKLENALESLSCDQYGEWLQVGMAMRLYGAQNGCEDEVWKAFDSWSSTTETGNYNQQQNLDAWNAWDTDGSGNPVTLGSVYHMAKQNGWTFDSRTLTSPQNGQNAGRPPSPPHADTAQRFYDETMVDEASGFPTMRYREGQWFGYSDTGWSIVPQEKIMSCISTYMQDQPDLRSHCSSTYFRSVRDNLASYNFCATGHHMPTWLDTGENADHWTAFSDGKCVNLLDLAKVLEGLAPSDECRYSKPVSPAFFSKSFVGYPMQIKERDKPLFEEYLRTVQPEPVNRKMLQQMAGLALTDETCYETCHALIGSGANGKTVFLDILQHLIGRNNVCFIPLGMITQRFQGFPLVENKLNICNEMATDTGTGNLHLIEGMLKDCISGGDVEVERKGIDKTFAPCRARFIFACNNMPTFVDKSDGIWRRLRVIDFPVTVPVEDRDVHLAEKIIASELPGVMLWALQGLQEVLRDGFVLESDHSKSLKNQHRLDCDKEKGFLQECCEFRPEIFESKEVLYCNYAEWCRRNGYRFPLSKNKFLARVQEIYPDLRTSQKGYDEMKKRVRCFDGLALTEDLLEEDRCKSRGVFGRKS